MSDHDIEVNENLFDFVCKFSDQLREKMTHLYGFGIHVTKRNFLESNDQTI